MFLIFKISKDKILPQDYGGLLKYHYKVCPFSKFTIVYSSQLAWRCIPGLLMLSLYHFLHLTSALLSPHLHR